MAAQYHRIPRRRAERRGIVAVAHTFLVTACHNLQHGNQNLGPDQFNHLHSDRLARYDQWRLIELGFNVTLVTCEEADE